MVLEHIVPAAWVEKKWFYAFALGIFYSIIGILLAKLLFPQDPALVSVAFIAILMLPELIKLFSLEERREMKQLSMRNLLRMNAPFIKMYLFLFLGILLVYSVASIALPSLESNVLLREQLEMRESSSNVAGQAYFDSPFFFSILINNVSVMIAIFLLSFLTGDGAIFLITWNASVWGAIFGFTAKNAAAFTGGSPIGYFLIIMLIVLPHVILEATAYILAAISGGVISKDVLRTVDNKRFHSVFFYNLWLFIIGIGVLCLGAFVETLVISNVPIYHQIIQQSLLFG